MQYETPVKCSICDNLTRDKFVCFRSDGIVNRQTDPVDDSNHQPTKASAAANITQCDGAICKACRRQPSEKVKVALFVSGLFLAISLIVLLIGFLISGISFFKTSFGTIASVIAIIFFFYLLPYGLQVLMGEDGTFLLIKHLQQQDQSAGRQYTYLTSQEAGKQQKEKSV